MIFFCPFHQLVAITHHIQTLFARPVCAGRRLSAQTHIFLNSVRVNLDGTKEALPERISKRFSRGQSCELLNLFIWAR